MILRRLERAAGAALALCLTAGAADAAERRCPLGLAHYHPQPVAFPSGASYLTAEGAIRIVGYNDMQGWIDGVDALFVASHPGFRFAPVLKGTRTGPPALTAGESAFAPMGAEFSPEAVRSYRQAAGNDPLPVRVAHDSPSPKGLSSPIAIFVHRSNPLARFSLDEARRVFAAGGGASRWGDLGLRGRLGGQPIHAVGLGDSTAIGDWMRRRALGGQPFAAGFVALLQSRAVVAAVGRDPLAIGFADLSLKTPQVKALALSEQRGGRVSRGDPGDLRAGRYPLDRHLLIYLRRGRDGALEPWIGEYMRLALSCEGQQLWRTGGLGYIPLNPQEAAAERAKLD